MNIGEFKMINGRLMGWIATRTIDLPRLYLRKVESSNDRAPAFEIGALNVGNRVVQIGALWQAIANATGEVFLQGSIDDPSLPEPLPIALFGKLEEGFRVAWRRPQRRDDFFAPSRGQRGDDGGMGEGAGDMGDRGGFGGSTAGADGTLMGAGGAGEAPLVDDDVPF
ncbi:DUF736 family protein [Sphingomonas oryzagri]|uniref:DUF736 family protein n=1 Tax=Sphingomonas oryzagri TaxID=3042314 RepID=A0ABT6N2C6_9SPHN|nr:DUF736 family protein [Sphingomonas oryzagri]MDH7639212.1 DUF736 family protein [Sphingomonas oryzagri]